VELVQGLLSGLPSLNFKIIILIFGDASGIWAVTKITSSVADQTKELKQKNTAHPKRIILDTFVISSP
jgi:hypothetical protein